MAYLNVDLDYFDHPKTLRLVCLLGKGSEVLPIKLWARVGKYHAKDGRLADYSAQEIESLVGWWGPSGKMVEALVKTGFLSHSEEGFYIHDWNEHQGHIWAFQEKGRALARARWDAASNAVRNASSIAVRNALTIPTKPNQTNHNNYRGEINDEMSHTPQTLEILAHFAKVRGIDISADEVRVRWRKDHGHAAIELDRLTRHKTELAKQAISEIAEYLDRLVKEAKISEWRNLSAINKQYLEWKAELDKDAEKKAERAEKNVNTKK